MSNFPLLKASFETFYMVFIAGFFSIFFGLVLGAILHLTEKKQTLACEPLHLVLSFLINMTRSIPFIILMISIIPLTRLLIGTTIGTNAAIVPLTLAAIPFFARICQNALAEVPIGLIETANAMGATSWQLLTKILIPESLPSLIRGATLTIIGLIGYSAMAGVVGGGGLGELAINEGYQQFNVAIMIQTIIILLVMVQLIQLLGDHLAKRPKIKALLIASIGLWVICFAYQFWPAALQTKPTLRVGIISGTSEKIMAAAKKLALEKYDLNLEVIKFSDYVQPNTALNNGSIDANIFQHEPYLTAQSEAHNYHLTPLTKTFVYPMGFYSQKIKSIDELKTGATIAIPNDPSNGGRALLLLQKAGLIELKPFVGTLGTVKDIIANPHQLQFKLLDAAQLPRILSEVDLAAITNDFIEPSGLSIQQAILKEGKDSPYANLIVIRKKDKNKISLHKLIAIMHSKEVVQETENLFPNGAAIPAWNAD